MVRRPSSLIAVCAVFLFSYPPPHSLNVPHPPIPESASVRPHSMPHSLTLLILTLIRHPHLGPKL